MFGIPQEQMNAIITLVIVPVILAVGGLLVELIRSWSKKIKANTSSEQAAKYIDIAERLVCQVVQKVFQTYVDTLKQSGKFGEEEARIAFSMAKMETLKLLKQSAREAIESVYGDLNTWLETQIEYNVKVKKDYEIAKHLVPIPKISHPVNAGEA